MTSSKARKRNDKGQSMVEYLVALGVVALVVGFDIFGSANNESVIVAFLNAIGTAWANLLSALSLPA